MTIRTLHGRGAVSMLGNSCQSAHRFQIVCYSMGNQKISPAQLEEVSSIARMWRYLELPQTVKFCQNTYYSCFGKIQRSKVLLVCENRESPTPRKFIIIQWFPAMAVMPLSQSVRRSLSYRVCISVATLRSHSLCRNRRQIN